MPKYKDENGNWVSYGGGSGTNDYEALSNKPSINGVELVGNIGAEELGLASKEEVETIDFTVSKHTELLNAISAPIYIDITERATKIKGAYGFNKKFDEWASLPGINCFKLSVNAGETYRLKNLTYRANVISYAFLDENETCIFVYPDFASSTTERIDTLDVTIPEGVAVLAVNSLNGWQANVDPSITVDSGEREIYVSLNILPSVLTSQNILYGKKLITCGDSITWGKEADIDSETGLRKSYGFYIAKRNGMTWVNDGVSGSTLQALTSNNGFSLPNGRYTQIPNDVDYIMIWFGWNDEAYGSLGSETDTDATESYYGAWNTVLPYIIDNHPNAKIGLICPYMYGGEGHREAVRKMAHNYGLKCLDLYSDDVPMFFGRDNTNATIEAMATECQAKWLADGTHPNDDGYKFLSTIIENFLRSL